MPLTLTQTTAVAELAEHLSDYLPGKPHPFADASVSFPGVATRVGVGSKWTAGSKTAAVRGLLERVLSEDSKRFCTLVLEVVRTSIGYRRAKNPLTRTDIATLDALVQRVGFRIKDLSDPAFLANLPSSSAPAADSSTAVTADAPSSGALATLKAEFVELASIAPVARGFKFESFLAGLFVAYGLAPRSSFRLVGEQIDGSCEIGGQTYLLEAKWQGTPTGQADLLVFSGKVSGKAQWARGLFVSYSGFSTDGLSAFRTGKATNIVCIDRADILFVLAGKAPLPELIRQKVRRAAEANEAFVPAASLFR